MALHSAGSIMEGEMRISKLFALGSNSSGQLGIAHANDTAVPQECVFHQADLESLSKYDKIVKIVAGGNHTLVRFESGAVFASGNNEHGQCGLAEDVFQTSIFRRVILPADQGDRDIKRFSDIAATWTASFMVENGQRIHVLGSGPKGELGLGEGVAKAQRECVIDIPEVFGREVKVGSISGGMSHVALLTSAGEAIGWGASRKGQLGDEAKRLGVVWEPKSIPLPFKTSDVVTGRNFSFFSNCNGGGVLLGDSKHLNDYPALEGYYQLVAGWSNIYALSMDGIKAIGRSDRGQLPHEELPGLKMISAGSEHCLGITTAGDAIAWGWGEHGNCGEPTDVGGNVAGRWNHLCIKLADNEVISLVAAGCATSFIIVDNSS